MADTTALSEDDPRMIAWAAYTAKPEFQNTKRWASFPEHSDGSLWAAFLSGFEAAPRPDAGQDEKDARIQALEQARNACLSLMHQNLDALKPYKGPSACASAIQDLIDADRARAEDKEAGDE